MAGPFNINPSMKRTVTISGFLSADDKPAMVDGLPQWTLDNDGGTIVVAADGMSADVSHVAMADDALPRNVRLTIKADANKDPDVQAFIEDFVDFVMIAPAGPVATKITMAVGEESAI